MGKIGLTRPHSGAIRWRTRATALSFWAVASFGLGACAELDFQRADTVPADPANSPQATEFNYERGKRELAAGRVGVAVRYFLSALDRAPGSVEALNGLGAAFDRLGRFDLSARAYGRALALDPDAVQTLNNLGYSYFLQGRYDLALAYLRDASNRAGAGALTRENYRLAAMASARAGGPAPRSPDPSAMAAPMPARAPHKPYIQRAGKAIRELVTKQTDVAHSGPAAMGGVAESARVFNPEVRDFAAPPTDLLPAFVAAPMAIYGIWAGAPALGAVRNPWPPKRAGELQ